MSRVKVRFRVGVAEHIVADAEVAEEIVDAAKDLVAGLDHGLDQEQQAELVRVVVKAHCVAEIVVAARRTAPRDVNKAEIAVKAVRRACTSALKALPKDGFIWPDTRDVFTKALERASALEPLLASRMKRWVPFAEVQAELRKLISAENAKAILTDVRRAKGLVR